MGETSLGLPYSSLLASRVAYPGDSVDPGLDYSGFWLGLSPRKFLDKVILEKKFLAFFVNP